MRAINLIPVDQRRVSGAAGRSGGAVYVVLGVLVVLVAMVGALTLANNQVADRRAEVEQLRLETQRVQATVAALATYKRFAELAKQRSSTVDGLVAGRFDWAHALREVARVVPSDVTLDRLTGSTGGAPAQGGVPAAAPAPPTITLVGCAGGQAHVARLIARLRALDGVERVSLNGSAKADASGGGEGSDCRGGQDQRPQFTIVTGFRPNGGLTAVQVAQPGPAGGSR